MNYDISIRPNRSGKKTANRGTVEYVFSKLAKVRPESQGVFVYADGVRSSFTRLHVGEIDPVESIRVSIPFSCLRTDGGSVLRLCFKIADELGWGILDEQLGGYIEPDAIADVLKRYEQVGETMTEFLDRRTPGNARFWDVFRFQLRTHSRSSMLLSIVLSAFLAGFMTVRLGGPAINFAWVSVVVLAGVIASKALVQSLRHRRLIRNSTRGNSA